MKTKPSADPHELKKYEVLYALSQSELEKGHSRFNWVEEKAGRQFSLLVVLMGLVSVGVPEYVSVLKAQSSWCQVLFVFLYPALAVCVLTSIFCYMRVISFHRYKNILLNKEMFDHFKTNRYVDVISSLSRQNAADLGIINDATAANIKIARIGLVFTRLSFIIMVATSVVYVVIKLT